MSVPAIALYASPPGGLCSAADFDLAPRPPQPPNSASGGSPVIGGLACLYSSLIAPCHASPLSSPGFSGRDEPDELGRSYSSYSSIKRRNPSPVSVSASLPRSTPYGLSIAGSAIGGASR